MKKIVCFGDSNTWGFDPATGRRFAPATRWTGVLTRELGSGCAVIEEGLNGRTTVLDDPIEGLHKNGRRYLLACLESQAPLDLLILMLGTNDLKQRYALPASDIAEGAGQLVTIARQSRTGPEDTAPRILLVSPIAIGAELTRPGLESGRLGQMFGQDSRRRSLLLPAWFREIARQQECAFFDAAEVAEASPLDAVHLDAPGHLALGRALAAEVRRILPAG
jgi:lysophospholipase L1-like esterase